MHDIPMVSILCLCYNHERYIRQALDGMLMQETQYSYEILINDDKSTDSSAAILREYEKKYPDMIKVEYQEKNLYSQGLYPNTLLLQKAQGKYIALCEGDDFWIDPHKLQKQIHFMEQHPEYSMTGHSAYVAYEDGVLMPGIQCPYGQERDVSAEEILSGWRLPTASLVYRRSAQKELVVPYRKGARVGDFCLGFYLALQGKVHFFTEPMSVYRYMSVASVMAPLLRDRKKLAAHEDEMAALIQRMDEYTDFQYHKTAQEALDGFIYNKYYALGDFHHLKELPLYQEKPLLQKCKIYLKQFNVFYTVKHFLKGAAEKYIIYPRQKKKTKAMDLPNIVILDPIKSE